MNTSKKRRDCFSKLFVTENVFQSHIFRPAPAPVAADLAEVCYNVVISAAAKNVRWPVAIQVFQLMRRHTAELTAAWREKGVTPGVTPGEREPGVK